MMRHTRPQSEGRRVAGAPLLGWRAQSGAELERTIASQHSLPKLRLSRETGTRKTDRLAGQ